MRSLRMVLVAVTAALVATCPAIADAQTCSEGRVSSAATSGRCCWPGQSWSRQAGACSGVPQCPTGYVAEGESCAPAAMPECTEGRIATTESAGRCCWPGQTWARDLGRCEGPPSCPPGLAASGDSCVTARTGASSSAPVFTPVPTTAGPTTMPTVGGRAPVSTSAASFVLDETPDEPLLLQYEDPDRPRRDRWVRLCTLPCDVDVRPGYRLGVGVLDRGVARFPSDYEVQPGGRVSLHYVDRQGLRVAGVVLTTLTAILGGGGVIVGALGVIFRWSSGAIIGGFAGGGGVLLIGVIIGAILATQGDGLDVETALARAGAPTRARAAIEVERTSEVVPTAVLADF